ncbi:MAG: nitroreductase family protein [Actinomycetota bacterium]|nr:nitroreductase family protein [Actinomycetota bacterium]MDQ3681211.1 nitroreductase family protein [Actinomycetota bacterium]
MEFQEVVRRRRMVRSYQDRPLPPGALERILANATRAPSAGFAQGWAFLVLEGKEETGRFWEATFAGRSRAGFAWPGLFRAPAIVVALSHKRAYLDRYSEEDKGWSDRDEARWPVPYWHVDTGFAALLMLLTAVDAGLGASFFGIFPDRLRAFRRAFDVPADHTPVGAITLGYPAADRPSRSVERGRRPVADVVHRGRW